MLTDTDINKLIEVFATKREVQAIKEDTLALRSSADLLLTSLDKLIKPLEDLRMEYAAVSVQLNRHEQWIKMIAEKIGIQLDPQY